MIAADRVEHAPPKARPEVHVAADVADRLDPRGQRGVLPGLAPELGHDLGIALELEAGRGQLRAGFLTMQEGLAELVFQAL